MRERYVGRSGLQVPRLGLGTWSWGRTTDEHEAPDVLRAYLDAGGYLLDTAPTYAGGASEELLGRMLGTVVRREEVVIASKAGLKVTSRGKVADTSRRSMLARLDDSLRRLGTDHLDLWQVHRWSPDVPLDETLSALDVAVTSGRVRYVGVSNYAGWQTALAHAWQTSAAGRAAIVSTQVEYSLLNRDVEHEVVPAAEALGVGVLAWSPLGRGVLTGKYRHGIPSDSRAASDDMASFVDPYLDDHGARVTEAVVRAADGLGLSPVEVALAWVRDRPGVTSVLLGARTADQLRACLSVEKVELPAEIVRALDDVSAGG
ncbi:MAG: aldo/keto reductase [Nocardioidaceae bacterium]|nr:aldo/keto reductase [Nocardioidaceae bacterium]